MNRGFERFWDGAASGSADTGTILETQKGKTVDLLLESKGFICVTDTGKACAVSVCGDEMQLMVLLKTLIKNLRQGEMSDSLIKAVLFAAFGE